MQNVFSGPKILFAGSLRNACLRHVAHQRIITGHFTSLLCDIGDPVK